MGEYVVNRPDEGAMEAALREGFAYRQDVARLLGVGVSQCRPPAPADAGGWGNHPGAPALPVK